MYVCFQYTATNVANSARTSIAQRSIHAYRRKTKEAGYFATFTELTIKDSGKPSE